ncbi:hypothetical protein OH492_27640 [Vibrio chagasii]|nr:hypothetical protein [Vibrio chagasii]
MFILAFPDGGSNAVLDLNFGTSLPVRNATQAMSAPWPLTFSNCFALEPWRLPFSTQVIPSEPASKRRHDHWLNTSLKASLCHIDIHD